MSVIHQAAEQTVLGGSYQRLISPSAECCPCVAAAVEMAFCIWFPGGAFGLLPLQDLLKVLLIGWGKDEYGCQN